MIKILVTGAGGKTGQAVIDALAKRDVKIRPFLHRPTHIPHTIEPVIGDMGNTNDWTRAMKGIDKVYHICPNMAEQEVVYGRLAIAAAQQANVQQFVYHSVLHPQTQKMPHHWHKLRVEEMLLESGCPFTILQPTAYMQNIRANWQHIRKTGIYAVPYAIIAPISLVDLHDVAEIAATVLTEPGHIGATYELVGTQALTQIEIANILSHVAGIPIIAQEITHKIWQQNAQATNLTPYAIETLLKMFRYYARYGLIGNPNTLHHLLKRPPTSLQVCSQQWED